VSEVNFTDTKFMTGKEKAMVLKQWRTFLKNGMASKSFSKRLYQHLILHCNFIAHYSREGFYNWYFGQPDPDQHGVRPRLLGHLQRLRRHQPGYG